MKMRAWWFAIATAAVVVAFPFFPVHSFPASQTGAGSRSPGENTAVFRVTFGLGDPEPTRWDGKVSATGGTVVNVRGWRFAGDDTAGNSSWKASTRRAAPNTRQQRLGEPGSMA
jgi:hypothetical protein